MGEAGWELVRDKHSRVQHFLALQKTYQHFAEKAQVRTVPRAELLRVAFIGGQGVVGKYSGFESCYEQTGARMAAKGHEITVYCRPTMKIRFSRQHRSRRSPTRITPVDDRVLEVAACTALAGLAQGADHVVCRTQHLEIIARGKPRVHPELLVPTELMVKDGGRCYGHEHPAEMP